MKDNMEFFIHDANAYNHGKFKYLRTHLGWEAEGRFWALNGMIAESPGCWIDMSKPYQKAAVAETLGMSFSELESFLEFLSDPEGCDLMIKDGERYTTERIQEKFRELMDKRAKDSARKKDVSEWNPDGNTLFPDGNDTIPTEKNDSLEQRREEERRREKNLPFQEIINYLDEKTGKSFKASTEATRKLISGRWSDGYRLEDFKTVIDNKTAEWLGDEKMVRFLRPATLFRPSHFDNYLNDRPRSPPQQTDKKCPDCGKRYVGSICKECGWSEGDEIERREKPGPGHQ